MDIIRLYITKLFQLLKFVPRRYYPRHYGYGMFFEPCMRDDKEEDGFVEGYFYILSVLVGSIAHSFGIECGDRIVSINGMGMICHNKAEFDTLVKETKPKKGFASTYVFASGKSFTATPELTKTDIPWTWSPNDPPNKVVAVLQEDYEYRRRFAVGFVHYPEIGQIGLTRRIKTLAETVFHL